METRFVDDDEAQVIMLSVTKEFADCSDDDWWTSVHVYDVNVWWCEEDDAYRVTMYKYTEDGVQTSQWQSLGVITNNNTKEK